MGVFCGQNFEREHIDVLLNKLLASFRLDYEYEIEYEYDFSILVFRLHIITAHTQFISWATLST